MRTSGVGVSNCEQAVIPLTVSPGFGWACVAGARASLVRECEPPIEADTLDYDEARQTARYLGNVKARRQTTRLETPDMTLRIANNELVEIVAVKGVTVVDGRRRGTGDSAVYDARTEEVT